MKNETNAAPLTSDELIAQDGVRDIDGTPRAMEAELSTLHDGIAGLGSIMSALAGMDHLQGKGYILGTRQDHIIGMIDCLAGQAARVRELWERMQDQALAARGEQA
jgi:hypothetical protein